MALLVALIVNQGQGGATPAQAPASPEASAATAAVPVGPGANTPTLTDLKVLTALREDGVEYTWPPPTRQVSDSGACGTNAAYQRGQATSFYLEQQTCAEDVLIPALLEHDQSSIDAALSALDWAFAREAANGSFPHEADAFHSTSIFLASAARSVLLLQESPYKQSYSQRLAGYVTALHRAARYEVSQGVLGPGRAGDRPYGHRRFLLGAAIGLVGDLARDPDLQAKARGFLDDGMALQRPDGEVPELGGPDSHYQAYGMVFAIDWLMYNEGDPIAPALTQVIAKAIGWESGRVGPTGIVSIADNTRTNGQEQNRDGTPKKLIYHYVIRALGEWALLRDSPALMATASLVSHYKQLHPSA